MLVALGTLASDQTEPTTDTLTAMTQLLNYAATHPDAVVEFRASDMVLHIESDASYLSESKGRSRFVGYHYLSDTPTDPIKAPHPDDPPPMHNGAIDIPCQIMDHVMASAADAEFGTLFHNGKAACPHNTCLHELGHPQPPTPIVTDNLTAAGMANNMVKQKRSKAMEMRFYWIRGTGSARANSLTTGNEGPQIKPIIFRSITDPASPQQTLRLLQAPDSRQLLRLPRRHSSGHQTQRNFAHLCYSRCRQIGQISSPSPKHCLVVRVC
jgi:hypothetical protein